MGEILAAAASVSSCLEGRTRCALLPSGDPAAFLVGLMACSQAGVAVAPWREGGLAFDVLVDTVRPDSILRFTPGRLGEVSLDPIDGPPPPGTRVGELIMLTSGSTGAPKGVALDFGQVMLNALSAGAVMEVWRCNAWAIDIDMALMSALSHMLMAWQYDLPLVHLGARDPADVVQLFAGGETGFGGSPVQLVRLTESLPAGVAPKMLVSSGDFLSPAMIDQVVGRFPETRVHKLYGLTELAGRFCCMPHDDLMADKAAAGYPLPGFAARLAADVPPGEIAEIEAKTPLMMAGYYRRGGDFEPRRSDWLATGDLGFIGPDGAITVVGRADDVVKVGGEKVDRQSIEQALAELLAPREYCVLGVDHPLVGQCPALFVAPASDGRPAPAWRDIVGHIRERLPARFVPGLMYGLDGPLPRLANGKVDRETLKASHRQFKRLS